MGFVATKTIALIQYTAAMEGNCGAMALRGAVAGCNALQRFYGSSIIVWCQCTIIWRKHACA